MDIQRSGYSDEEVQFVYELGRFCLENGDVRRGEQVMQGLTQVAPEFAPAWLGLSYIHILQNNFDAAIYAARQALNVQPNFLEAMLFLVACLLTTEDYTAAGTYLGELGERIEAGGVDNPHITRFYKMQLGRYQNR